MPFNKIANLPSPGKGHGQNNAPPETVENSPSKKYLSKSGAFSETDNLSDSVSERLLGDNSSEAYHNLRNSQSKDKVQDDDSIKIANSIILISSSKDDNDLIEVQSLEGVKDEEQSAKVDGIPNSVLSSPKLSESNLTKKGSAAETTIDIDNNDVSANEKLLNNNCLNEKSSPTTSKKSNDSANSKAEFYIGDYDSLSPRPSTAVNEKSNGLFRKTPRRVQITAQVKKSPTRLAPEFTPPDGGYGWVVALSACVINAFNVGIIKSYGVLYIAIAKKFPEASAYQASWLPVLLSTIGLLTAPIIGFLCRKFTSRKVSFVGSLISFAGLLLGAYARSMTELILTFGLLTGLGNGLTSTPGVLITSLYFEERRGIASAICVSGNAIGGFIFPPVISYLLSEYEFDGAMLILSALVLNMCAASLLYRPIRVHALIQQRKRLKQIAAYQGGLGQKRNCIEEMSSSSPILNKSASLRRKMSRKRMISECSTTGNDEELHRQVSFMRSSSIMSSIPDLNQYARSWNINNNPNPPSNYQTPVQSNYYPPAFSRQSSRRYSRGSKLSLSNIANMVNEKASQDFEKGAVTWVSALDRVKHVNSQNSLRSMMGSTDSRKVSLCRQMSAKPYSERPNSPLDPIDDEETDLFGDDIAEIAPYRKQSIASNTDSNRNLAIQRTDAKVFVVGLRQESKDEDNEPPKTSTTNCFSFLDCSLMKNHKFLLISLTIMMFAAGAPHAIFFLPAYATDIGIENTRVISLLSISSIIDLFGRLGIGFLADLKIVPNSIIYGVSAAMAGISIFLIPFVESYIGMGICVGIYGFGVGAWFVMIPTILAKNHGPQRLAASFGLVRMFQGLMNFASPQICGLLIDSSKSFQSTYLYMGSSMMTGGFLMMIEPLISKSKCLKNRQEY